MSAPLKGLRALVTAGPTYEPIDPVRFIGNRSSGKQGYAIASALAAAGADVTLVSGPTALNDPAGMKVIRVETAREMLEASLSALPCSIAVCAAAVGDWAPQVMEHKIKKRDNKQPPSIQLFENPDILQALSTHDKRPALVVGFAAETEHLLENAREKRERKGCDWIVANSIQPGGNVFGSDENHAFLLAQNKETEWPMMSKADVAARLADEIVEYFK